GEAAMKALHVDRAEARQRAMRYSWKACAEMFLDVVDEALGRTRKLAA
ncbi:glycosyltransferase family 1 protein, partial [Mesorhizobium sp. M4B.F.Ca.ET.169.01.1.1]